MKARITTGLSVMLIVLVSMQVIGCSGTSTPAATAQPSPSTITAMDGYPSAEKAAKALYGDATMTCIVGYTLANTTATPAVIDGRSASWLYSFVSPSAKRTCAIAVYSNNTCRVMDSGTDRTISSESLARLQDIRPAADWKIDSTRATQAALSQYEEKYGTQPLSAIYTFLNAHNLSGHPYYYWGIMFQGDAHESVIGGMTTYAVDSLTVLIDPMTGDLLPDQMIYP